jgi:hypothetical protein
MLVRHRVSPPIDHGVVWILPPPINNLIRKTLAGRKTV